MRKLVIAVLSVAAVAGAVAPAASAAPRTSKLALTAKITGFRATAAGVVANGTFSGTLRSGSGVTHQSTPVRFAVLAKASHGVFLPLETIDEKAVLKAYRDLLKQKPQEPTEGEGVTKELQAL